MRRSRTIRTRCGPVVVEHGRVGAKRRQAVARKRVEVGKTAAPASGLAAELARMLRGRLSFPEALFSRNG